MSKPTLETLANLAKRRGFIYQGSDIYGGLAGTWDYGPLGTQLKRNIQNLWWKMFVEDRADMFALDPAILMNQKVWQASGHLDTFHDPLIECKSCHQRFRADHIKKDTCPNCGKKGTFTKSRNFNLMFKTHAGPVEGDEAATYLRPELAQGVFTNYRNVVDNFYPDIPFGLAAMGRVFRNEISPREFTFRVREFDLMEFEYFIVGKDWEKQFKYWHQQFYKWTDVLGLDKKDIHELEVPASDRAHYSKRTIDFEYKFSFGTKEIGAVAYRTDFDLKNHAKNSGVNMEYTVKGSGEKFVPHVIEPTFGVDRNLLAVLSAAYQEEEVKGDKRVVLRLKPELAPVKVAVLPLSKDKKLSPLATKVYEQLKEQYLCEYDETQSIGKRYRRQDEIGTPYCVTIDFDSLKDKKVTVRDRDTMKQSRVNIIELNKALEKKL